MKVCYFVIQRYTGTGTVLVIFATWDFARLVVTRNVKLTTNRLQEPGVWCSNVQSHLRARDGIVRMLLFGRCERNKDLRGPGFLRFFIPLIIESLESR